MVNLSPEKIKQFQEKIFSWWKENKRELPWRKTKNPYHIMIAEVMLQQTQVSRVIDKYKEFLEEFPTLSELANASTAHVLKVWSGLGYNRRALWLLEAAKKIKEKETFPTTIKELRNLKGIGSYTSRSILIFAFNQSIVTIDTNIRRILIAEGFADEDMSEKELLIIAKDLLPRGRSRDWHNALMDYGSLVKTSANTGVKPSSNQKKYQGSDREYRGKIVKYLTQKSSLTKKELLKNCKIPKNKIDVVLASLIKDGLIHKKNQKYMLPE
ncbi:MAG: Fe-S cluster assembly protein HesB [Asgard group archaeon]|nr:Fe-S cluster assembly protein HesB [Asgard group archaeon]